MTVIRHPSSFRDPSGFLFTRGGVLYRQVQHAYQGHFDLLETSGLYEELVRARLLIPHEIIPTKEAVAEGAYKVLKPLLIPFISYPYEWCFSELKDAALATLAIQKRALARGMSLKDASAYNIQFLNGKPILIDTLSFERYREGTPWIAYRQFCQHFLAPLALMSYTDARLRDLLRLYIDGVPLDLASALLPARTRLRFSLLSHIHLHAKSQNYFAEKEAPRRKLAVSKRALLNIVENLERAILKLVWNPTGTEWAEYYSDTNYSKESFDRKIAIVDSFLEAIHPKNVWDYGGNDGLFSRRASDRKIMTVCFDNDPAAVEKNYRMVRTKREEHLLPLVMDLTNPSPPSGWGSEERLSLVERGPADCALALALLHHLAIGNNVPFSMIAHFFARMARHVIIEFIPKGDSQVRRLLRTREDVFDCYTESDFESSFAEYFTLQEKRLIDGSKRVLYLFRNKREL